MKILTMIMMAVITTFTIPLLIIATPIAYIRVRRTEGGKRAVKYVLSFYFGILMGLAFDPNEIRELRRG